MSLTKATYSMIVGACANVLDFGADATGTNDSAQAIQDAIDSGAGAVYFPSGTYKVSTQINCAANQKLFGDGFDSIVSFTGTETCFYIANRFVTIENIYLVTATGKTGIEIYPNTSSVLLRGVKIFRFSVAGIYAHDPAGGTQNLYGIAIQSCWIGECGRGLWLYGKANLNDVWVQNCQFEDNGSGGGIQILINGGIESHIDIRDCIIQGGNVRHIQIECGKNITIENNYFESSVGGLPAIKFHGTGTATNVQIKGNTLGVNTVNAPVLLDPTFTIDGFVVSGNNGTAQGVALIATTDLSPAQIFNVYVGENPSPSSWVPIFNPDPTALTVPVNPTSIQMGWNRIGRLDVHATSDHAATLTGTGAARTGDLAWQKSDNRSYYVGVGYDEPNDRFSINVYNGSAFVSAFYVARTTGRLGIGSLTGLPQYANNAAAIAGGLPVGAFYRTGGDPDTICVVH